MNNGQMAVAPLKSGWFRCKSEGLRHTPRKEPRPGAHIDAPGLPWEPWPVRLAAHPCYPGNSALNAAGLFSRRFCSACIQRKAHEWLLSAHS